MCRSRTSLLLVVALAALLTASLPAGATTAAKKHKPPQHEVKITKVVPGLTLKRIIDRKTPRRTFVLRADLSTPIAFDVTLAGNGFPMRDTTTRMAKRAGAVAAVNGDFGSNSGTVTHPFAEDGELIRTSAQLGAMFAVSADEQHVFVGLPTPQVMVTNTSTGLSFTVDRWNDGDPGIGEIAAFTSVGGTEYAPPRYACSVHLAPAGAPTFAEPDGIDQTFTVDQSACQPASIPPSGGLVLASEAGTSEATLLRSIPLGAPILLHWTLGWPGVLDAIGGVPLLVADGSIVVDKACSESLCRANPRTGIGVTAGGRVLLVVVDGRQAKWSVGVTLFQFAKIMKDQGAVFAMNLDGGGSSTMVVKGDVVNRPSDGFQRRVSNAAVILPGPEPAGTP